MRTDQFQPRSANWNQIKSESTRNVGVFELLKKVTKDKDAIKLLDGLITSNKEIIKSMESLEKTPDVFKADKPFAEYKDENPRKIEIKQE